MIARRSFELLNSSVLWQAHLLHLCCTLSTNSYKYIFIIINIFKQIKRIILAMENIKRSDSEAPSSMRPLAYQLN